MKIMQNNYFKIALVFMIANVSLQAQDLLSTLDKYDTDTIFTTIATFKSTRLGLMHSTETRKKGALQLSVYQRYWDTPAATSQNFLADKLNNRFGLDYAFTDALTIGFGYADYDKVTDAYVKYNVKQQTGKGSFNFTVLQTFSQQKTVSSTLYATQTSNRYGFTTQAIVSKKINPFLSLQVAPILILKNQVQNTQDPKTQFATAFGGRYKINNHLEFVSEYYWVANKNKSFQTYAPFLAGLNWEASDLMLQFFLTNASSFAEDIYITQTPNNFNFKDPNLHFGFNATFILHTKKNKLENLD